ncbi:zinc finger CCHC domain-containing protein 7-like isoform X1 [Stylophora pistillata]|uniref:Zinc finger CCHC domain-containing protein 7 n=1 Tax=Stylophora pistillata TaxID=50429 RepID=A0A2B4SK34_STYPI|nr:zinc finger CCHC domain-containing protein 7-like isoform X1 [Stylophora pistillata]XP_022783018.1 zinc finger CCHC domain-containing protein 7-like isoform X1 [Stylophora pistillata]PFX30251.1 Zinc finger CCHC domain-containing protein 7 [Stylophora pistillata]
MSSDDEFDSDAYQAYEDQLYREHSSSGSENDVDSEIEETLYCHVHYASSLPVSEKSAPDKVAQKRKDGAVTGLDNEKDGYQSNNLMIEISSDDEENCNDDDDGNDNKNITSKDVLDSSNACDNLKLKSSFNYPEIVNLFPDENVLTSKDKVSKQNSPLGKNKGEPREITENWSVIERDLEDPSVSKRHSRYYTPGKGAPYRRCHNCNEKGHLSQFCPLPKKTSVCFLCGGCGHIKRSCPNELCFNCHEPGHKSKNCRKPRLRPFDRCNRCHVLGHYAMDCPDRWRQYHLTIKVGPIIRPERPLSPPRAVSCYNCGDQGHYGHECQEENATRRQELPLPFVVCYDGCYTSSSLNKINYDGNKESSKSRENMHHQTFSDRFCDQPGQQNFDIDKIAFQPPPEKVRKLGENLDGRKVSLHTDIYQRRNVDDSPYSDRKRKRKKQKDNGTNERNERFVEIVDFTLSEDGLAEEPYQVNRKKKQGKQRWRGEESLDDNFDNRSINARNSSHQRNDKKDFKHRSFHDREFDSRNTSFKQTRDSNFKSRSGFRFNNEKPGKKSISKLLKRYTF